MSYIGSVTAIRLACNRIAFLSDISTAKRSMRSEKNVSESIFEYENHERDRNMKMTKRKKMDFIGLEHHNRTTCIQI